jgi:UDP-glucose 4-epimerase
MQSSFPDMRVLITGGAGFIGSHIAEHFQGLADVRILDDFRTGRRSNLEGLAVDLREGSILDAGAVRLAVEGVDYVFHLAAFVSVPESVAKPEECELINTEGTRLVLEESARAGVKKLCLSSSAAIYGDNPVVPKVESMDPEPMSPYAATKLEGEKLCAAISGEGRLATASLRYFNVFGPRQDPGSAYAAAVPIFIAKALAGEDIIIHGDGGQTRDFVYVKDVVAANVHAATHAELAGVYNVGYGASTTILGLAQEIVRLAGSDSRIVFEANRAGDVRHSLADASKLFATGFRPAFSLESGLAETLSGFRKT